MTFRRFAVITVCSLILSGIATRSVSAQEIGTLYSPYKYQNENPPVCLNFQSGLSTSKSEPCDLRFGFLGINDDFNWLQSSTARENRSVIKDLGSALWTDAFAVPLVAALPKLEPGEQRRISIDVSGADGRDGAPGADADHGFDSAFSARRADSEAIRRSSDSGFSATRADPDAVGPSRDPGRLIWQPAPVATRRPKNDGKPKIDPLFVKASVGHMYVIHVVDDVRDFYALFRVDALDQGTCTISWKLIPNP